MIDVQRARGLMEGIAVGNLLGIAVEGWPRWRIAERHPDGIDEIHARTGFPDDDDLAQSIVVAEAAIEGPLDIDDLANRLWVWGEDNGLGMGGLTRPCAHVVRRGQPSAAGSAMPSRQHWCVNPPECPPPKRLSSAWAGKQAGNGALMRCAPLALRWAGDPIRLVRESVISAVPTHWDPRCGWSCALANLAAAAALQGRMLSDDELLELGEQGVLPGLAGTQENTAMKAKAPGSLVQAVEAAWRSDVRDIRFDGKDKGFTLLTLQAALISWWRAEDFESGLSEVVEAGGDTDTNGAVVGALLGARFGLAGIPEHWQTRVREIRADRRPMADYADALIRAAESR